MGDLLILTSLSNNQAEITKKKKDAAGDISITAIAQLLYILHFRWEVQMLEHVEVVYEIWSGENTDMSTCAMLGQPYRP